MNFVVLLLWLFLFSNLKQVIIVKTDKLIIHGESWLDDCVKLSLCQRVHTLSSLFFFLHVVGMFEFVYVDRISFELCLSGLFVCVCIDVLLNLVW